MVQFVRPLVAYDIVSLWKIGGWSPFGDTLASQTDIRAYIQEGNLGILHDQLAVLFDTW